MSDEVKLYTDIECFTREFSFIKMQYCMPYFKKNYKEEHKIYEQYELLITKMFKKLYGYEQENKQLKEKLENKFTPDEIVDMLNKELVRQNNNYKDILTELEEWLETKKDEYSTNLEYLSLERMCNVKDKIQELKEKYK